MNPFVFHFQVTHPRGGGGCATNQVVEYRAESAMAEQCILPDTIEQTQGIVENLFAPHPHLADHVNHNIIQSEVEGGVYLGDLPAGSVLLIQTQNRIYRIVPLGDRNALISGHPQFCPEPAAVRINGSTWGGSMLKMRFVGRGMHLEFEHPSYRTIITSRIIDIRADRC
jgi:hypothetical protein